MIEIKDGDLILVANGYAGNPGYLLARVAGKITAKTACITTWGYKSWYDRPSRKDRSAIKYVLPAGTDPAAMNAKLRNLYDQRSAAIKQVNEQHESRIEKLISEGVK